jgi:hypothetical protein
VYIATLVGIPVYIGLSITVFVYSVLIRNREEELTLFSFFVLTATIDGILLGTGMVIGTMIVIRKGLRGWKWYGAATVLVIVNVVVIVLVI